VIAGNPNAHRGLFAAVIVLLLLALVVMVWRAGRKKTAPQQVPPLSPQTLLQLALPEQ
jgi:hypothetical protein